MANIVIMPGGFHPFHAGHAALYNSIKEKYGEGSDIYVAASDNQKERPFPFKIKEKLAQISGVQPGEFVQVKSPFVPKEITDKYDPDKDTIVFVRSEKDKDEYPKPGAVKKDGSPGYFQHIDTAQRGAQPFSKVGYMDYLPVKEFAGITSATQIRDTWPSLNDDQREEFVTHIYPNLKGNDKLIKNVVKLLSKGMSLNEGLAYIDAKGNRVDYTRPDLPTDIENLVIDWFNDRDRYTKATLKQKGYTVDVDDKVNNIDVVDKKGRKYTVSVDDAMGKLIQQAYQEPIDEAFVDPDQSKQYWNHDAQKIGVGGQIEFPLTDKPNLNGRRQGFSESLNKIRGMIKETTDEQKSKSVDLHRKLFELFEEEKNNVIKLRGFGREADKRIPDINKVRAEKEREKERENSYYSERRAEQEELLARLQAELLNAKQEFSELADAKLLPIEMLDTMESITDLIDYIENWEGSEDQNNFPFTEDLIEKLHLKTVQLKEYFGGTRDTSAPKVLRKQTPKLDVNSFWNITDLSETADYIEEK
jgi:hypothetical protein